MKVLNRQSELYQHLYNDALMRLARVPELINLKAIRSVDFLNYPSEMMGYVFNRDELELPSPDPYDKTKSLGEFVSDRLHDAMLRGYGSSNRAGISVPVNVAWPSIILSVLGEMRRGITATREYIDIEQTAHYAVMRHAYQMSRVLNRGQGHDRIKGDRLTLDQAIMELLGGKKPTVAKPRPGFEGKITTGLVGSNPLNWGMQANYNACESVVSYLNGVSVATWSKLLESVKVQHERVTITYHINAPWAVNRLPVEGEAFIDAYGVPAISTIFGNLVDAYYRTDESMPTERALEIIRTYAQENDTELPSVRIMSNLRTYFRSKWLELDVVDPVKLRDIAQEAFDEQFQLIRAVRVVREHIVG